RWWIDASPAPLAASRDAAKPRADEAPSSRIQPFPHAHSLLDRVSQLFVEGDHSGVRGPNLEIDFQTTLSRQHRFHMADQSAANPTVPVLRVNCDGIDPAAVAVVTAHDRAHYLSGDVGDEEQVALERPLEANGRDRIVVRRGIGQGRLPERDHGRFIGIIVGAYFHYRFPQMTLLSHHRTG